MLFDRHFGVKRGHEICRRDNTKGRYAEAAGFQLVCAPSVAGIEQMELAICRIEETGGRQSGRDRGCTPPVRSLEIAGDRFNQVLKVGNRNGQFDQLHGLANRRTTSLV